MKTKIFLQTGLDRQITFTPERLPTSQSPFLKACRILRQASPHALPASKKTRRFGVGCAAVRSSSSRDTRPLGYSLEIRVSLGKG
jgi:hypothetical protein